MKPLGPIAKTLLVEIALALLVTLVGIPALAQQAGGGGDDVPDIQAQYLADLEGMESKFLDLAEAMTEDMYSWRPMEGVRSVSEVFMLIVAENYVMPTSWGAEAPEGMTVDFSLFGTFAEVTDKASVLEHLRQSFAFCKEAVTGFSDEQLAATIQFFGSERSVNEAMYLIGGDMHEHLGQAIAYARMNQVVPPWTARRQQ